MSRIPSLPLLCLGFLLFALFPPLQPNLKAAEGERVYAVFNIDRLGFEKLEKLKRESALIWWAEMGDGLFALTDRQALEKSGVDVPYKVLDAAVKPENLQVVSAGHGHVGTIAGDLLFHAGRFAIVQRDNTADLKKEPHKDVDEHACMAVTLPFEPNKSYVRQAFNAKPRPVKAKKAETQALLNQLNQERWLGDIQSMAEFNRFVYEADIVNARNWIQARFQEIEGLQVSLQSFELNDQTLHNVIAVLPGTTKPDEWYIIGAHYDSISESTDTAAPGAEDNASGVAGVLEMARIFAANPPEQTLIFIAYSGEELGLHGSRAHVASLLNSGDSAKLKNVLIMDMISFSEDDDLDVLLETGSVGEFMLDVYSDAAAAYTDLRVLTTLSPSGSDHVPYISNNLPAMLVIENDWFVYPGYHRTTDVYENIVPDMGMEILKMNVAALNAFLSGDVNTLDHQYIIPHIPPANGWDVHVGLTNPNGEVAQVAVTLYEVNGIGATVSRGVTEYNIPAYGSMTLTPEGSAQRWLRIQSSEPLSGMHSFAIDRGFGYEKAGLPLFNADRNVLYAQDYQSDVILYPHVPADRGRFWSGGVLLNTLGEAAFFTFHLYGSGGQSLNHLLTLENQGVQFLNANEKKVFFFQSPDESQALFDDSASTDKVSWVLAVSEASPMMGFELFGRAGSSGEAGELAAIPARYAGDATRRMLGLDLSLLDYRAFSILNSAQEDTHLNAFLIGGDGAVLWESNEVPIDEGRKILGLFDGSGLYFPYSQGATPVVTNVPSASHLIIESPIGLDVFELSGRGLGYFDGSIASDHATTLHFGGLQTNSGDAVSLQIITRLVQDVNVTAFDANGTPLLQQSYALGSNGSTTIDLSNLAGQVAGVKCEGPNDLSAYCLIRDSSRGGTLLVLGGRN